MSNGKYLHDHSAIAMIALWQATVKKLSLVVVWIFAICTFNVRGDELLLVNGDRVSGRLVAFSKTYVEISTPYAKTLQIERKHVKQLSTDQSVEIDIVSGERLIGKVRLRDDGQAVIVSQMLGERRVPIEAIERICASTERLELSAVRGEGADRVETTEKSSAVKQIGQNPEEKEELRKMFLRQSSVLLRHGQVEGELSFGYQRTQFNSAIVSARSRQLTLTPSLRVGIADRAEAFVLLPFTYSQTEVAYGGGANSLDKFGFADLSAGVKYMLIQESQKWPEVVASVSFVAPSGGKPDETLVSLGSGHWGVKSGLEFIKTFDPVVLFWGVDYSHQFEARHFYADAVHDVQPGEALGYNFGLGFAINENIAVSSQLLGSFMTEDLIDGKAFGGSSREPISLRLALTDRWSKNTYIEPAVAFGLNSDAPDVNLQFSLVHKF